MKDEDSTLAKKVAEELGKLMGPSNKKNDINSLAQRHAEELSKYTYFMLAASGSAIAYALDQAEGKVLIKEDFLFIALIVWCLSFFFGVGHIRLFHQHMIKNANCILEDLTGEQMLKELNPIVTKMERNSNLQYYLFLVGVVMYILWRA